MAYFGTYCSLFLPFFFIQFVQCSGSTEVPRTALLHDLAMDCFLPCLYIPLSDCTIFREPVVPFLSLRFSLLMFGGGFQRVSDSIPFCTGVLFFHGGRRFGCFNFLFSGWAGLAGETLGIGPKCNTTPVMSNRLSRQSNLHVPTCIPCALFRN